MSKNIVILRFTTTYNNNTLRHGKERIHGGGIAVELIEEDVAGVKHSLVFAEGNTFSHS